MANSILKDPYTRDTIVSLMAGIKAHNSQMIVGNPGLGKSALVSALAKDVLRAKMITIIGSQKEPQDVTGFPRLVDKPLTDGSKISVTKYAIPEWEFMILLEKKIVLFLDEFSNSTPAVQAAMLQILNEREFPDGHKLPDETIIIGAMNPVETAADGYELGLPVTNRLKFIPWEPSFESWSTGLLSNWGHLDTISADEMWWRRKIVDFLRKNMRLLYKLPDKKSKIDPNAVYRLNGSPAENDIFKMAYPSNRSWTNLASELPYCKLPGHNGYDPSLISKSANGIVGYEAARSFIEYLDSSQSNVPTPKSALSDPSTIPFGSLDFNQLGTLYENCIVYAGKSGDERVLKALINLTKMFITNGKGSIYTMQHAKAVQVMRSLPGSKELVSGLDKMASSNDIGEMISGWKRSGSTSDQLTDVI